MSVYKNTAARFVLPLLNKTFRHKNTISAWNIKSHNKYHSTYIDQHYSHANSNKILQNQFRSIHVTSSVNKVISFHLSDIGEGIREVIVKEWYVKEGDKVAQFDNICEVQSDKASVTITSRYDGVVSKLYHAVDDIALVGKPLIDIDTLENDDSEVAANETIEKQEEIVPEVSSAGKESTASELLYKVFAIPSVRRIAKEKNIQLSDVKGTGKDGRILKEDILNYIDSKSQHSTESQDIQIEPIRGYKRAMIKTMTEAMKIPHFVYHEEIRVTNLVKLREKLKQKSDTINVKITYVPFFIKAVSNALSRFPILNARLDEAQENIFYFKSHNIGVAMDTPTGLAVPVIKNVQSKNVIEISRELNRLQDLGKQSKFSKDDLSDGTFSFSNIGAIGGTYAKPIILPPQSAIIALGAFQVLPRFADDGTIAREVIANFSGAADHRIVDGATMARFCNVLKEQIENPAFLFLNV